MSWHEDGIVVKKSWLQRRRERKEKERELKYQLERERKHVISKAFENMFSQIFN